MPSEEEMSPTLQNLFIGLPKIEFNNSAVPSQPVQHCPICGLTLSLGLNCPRCFNLIL